MYCSLGIKGRANKVFTYHDVLYYFTCITLKKNGFIIYFKWTYMPKVCRITFFRDVQTIILNVLSSVVNIILMGNLLGYVKL